MRPSNFHQIALLKTNSNKLVQPIQENIDYETSSADSDDSDQTLSNGKPLPEKNVKQSLC